MILDLSAMPATTSTAILPSLPPTVNSLHASQRARLQKSTRKLADVLGTTPHLLDSDLSPTRPSSPTSVLLYIAPSPSLSFTDLPIHGQPSNVAKGAQPKGHRRRNSIGIDCPLLRCLRKVHSKCHADANINSQQPSAASIDNPAPLALTLPPPSPHFEQGKRPIVLGDEANIRRKRISKLTRTLGENIPIELVFSQPKGPFQPHEEHEKMPKPHCLELHHASLRPPPDVFQPGVPRLKSKGNPTVPSGKHPSLVGKTPLVRPSVEQPRNNDLTWDGEWNIKDAEKRAMALRNLRSR